MIWAVVVILFSLAAALLLLPRNSEQLPQVDPEEAVKAAIELHAIRRRLDVAWTQAELRSNAAWVRRRLASELETPPPPETLDQREYS